MTITTETNKAQATGNGSVKDFTYSFPIQSLSHAQIFLGDVKQSSGYVVEGIGDPAGGTVKFTVAPAAGVLVTILRVVPLTQQVDYSPYDAFPAETHEGALDKLTTITQQMQEELDRAWKVPIDTAPGVDVAPPAYSAGDVIGWSETNPNELVNYPGIGTFTGLVDDAEAAASGAATSEANAQAYASSAQGSATSASNSANAAANSASAAQVAKMEWQGPWNSAQSYFANDVIEYLGSSYVALISNTNVTPVVGATWDLVALKGAKGDPGQSGTGTGDVNGPAVSTPNAIALYDSTDGTVIKDGPRITTSATDTTAGRVTKVGDFGLGAAAIPILEASINAANIATGFYAVSVDASGFAPVQVNGYMLYVDNASANFATRTYTVVTTGAVYEQTQSAGTWGAWREVWTTGNLVKTTSPTDSTAGSMLKVGDFGVGSISGPIAADTRLQTVSGLWRTNVSTLNLPAGVTTNCQGMTIAGSATGALSQMLFSQVDGRMWLQQQVGGVWSGWVEVVRSGSTPTFINVKDKFTSKGNVTGTVAIDPTVDGGDVQFTMTGNTAVTFTTSGIASGESAVCSVQVLGAFAVTWPAGIFWPTGGIPAYTAPSIYTFQFRNNGGTIQIFGFQSGKGMAAV